DLPWWDLFQDEQLSGLVRTALEQNKDLAIAAARVDEARARYGFTRADQLPVINLGIDATRGRTSEQLPPGTGNTSNVFVGRIDAFYEVDLWGKYRRATEAARADIMGTEMARQTVVLSLVAEVAASYFALLDLDNQLAIAKATLEARTESLRIITARFEKGVVSALDVHQAEIQESIAAAAIPTFERLIVETEDRIRILLGMFPGDVARGRPLEEQAMPPDVPAGLTSEFLRRRPDVQASEQALIAANARIGVAEAQRFPLIGLTASAGVASDDLSNITKGGAGIWSIGGTLLQPLFNYGKNKRRVEIARAQTEQALLGYEASVQQAFSDVEDALVAVRTTRERSEVLERQVVAARAALTLSEARYDQGVTSYLEVLIQQTTAFEAELGASLARRDVLTSVVRLYSALGGGWGMDDSPAPAAAPPTAPAPASAGTTPHL
ncbi:MAG TPA: efflux transporter outer membrane subunit, partial [Candidatus Polarisedimenticolia bacterium]|nr:efflux transporter outer membrane subunit [Candidatus Polarisedimenticolia bacterium]